MATWTVVPSLLSLRAEFNRLSPNRDKGADGTIGDTAHTSSSDHTPDEDSRVLKDHDADEKNEVHALDIDSSGPWPGAMSATQKERFHQLVMRVIAGEREKWLSATDRCRLNYVIWDRKIYDKDQDFEPRTYTGPDPHTNHGHFSARYETSCENDTRPWGAAPITVQEDDVTPQDKTDIINGVIAKLKDANTGSDVYPGRDLEALAGDLHAFLDDFAGDGKGAAVRPTKPGSLGDKLRTLAVADLPARVLAVEGLLRQILDVLNTPAPPAGE